MKKRKTNTPVNIDLAKEELANIVVKLANNQADSVLKEMLDNMHCFQFPNMPGMENFGIIMVCQELLEREKHIISAEWYESRGVKPIESSIQARERYVSGRALAEQRLGKDTLQNTLSQVRAQSNKSARQCLDSSQGIMYYYVLPTFNSDGSHEPVGPKDIPWGHNND